MSSTLSSDSPGLTDSRLAARCAETAERAFEEYQEHFHAITGRARDRFLTRDVAGTSADATERLRLYNGVLDRLTTEVESLMGGRLGERSVWTAIKAVYSSLIAQAAAWEIAESFFNSLTRRVFATDGVDQTIEFFDTHFHAPPASAATRTGPVFTGKEHPGVV